MLRAGTQGLECKLLTLASQVSDISYHAKESVDVGKALDNAVTNPTGLGGARVFFPPWALALPASCSPRSVQVSMRGHVLHRGPVTTCRIISAHGHELQVCFHCVI